jgi:hypothetical protein
MFRYARICELASKCTQTNNKFVIPIFYVKQGVSRMRCETRIVYHTYGGLALVGVLPQVPSLAEGVGRQEKFVM